MFCSFWLRCLGFVFRGFIIAGAVNRYIFCSPVLWMLCTGLSLLDTLSDFISENAPGVLCIRVWMDCKCYFSSYSAICPVG